MFDDVQYPINSQESVRSTKRQGTVPREIQDYSTSLSLRGAYDALVPVSVIPVVQRRGRWVGVQ